MLKLSKREIAELWEGRAFAARWDAEDGWRLPGWRWEHANKNWSLTLPFTPNYLDNLTRSAYAFLKNEQTGRRPSRPVRHAEVAEAVRIHQANGQQRWELEARVLMNEDPVSIADKCRISTRVLALYEALFFDVRTRLSHRTLIHNKVIQNLHTPIASHEVGRVWQYYAYRGGPILLDALIKSFRSLGKPDYTHLTDGSPPVPGRSREERSLDRALMVLFLDAANLPSKRLLEFDAVQRLIAQEQRSKRMPVKLTDNLDNLVHEAFEQAAAAPKPPQTSTIAATVSQESGSLTLASEIQRRRHTKRRVEQWSGNVKRTAGTSIASCPTLRAAACVMAEPA